jgi:hypothetical protein
MTKLTTWVGRRVRDRLGLQRRPGSEALSVVELVSPFRYDIVVRQQLFEWLDRNPDLADDEPALLAGAASQPYRTWFDIFGLQGGAGAWWRRRAVGTYDDQVRRAVDIWRRFDPDAPVLDRILVRTVDDGARTTNGKLLSARALPVDGFHRLALCRRHGIASIPAGSYDVLETSRVPVDNTERLLRALKPDLASYLAFLAEGYGVGAAPTVEELLGSVSRARPDRVEELRSVLAVDLPALGLVAQEEVP